MMMTLTELARALSAPLRGEARFNRVVIDTRAVQAGDLFVALRGERFDGHDFVAQARAAGAVAALVSRWVDADIPQLCVADTLDGLQRMAALWRARFAGTVIGVTGSNGKTTTKQLLASVMRARGDVLATQGNLNNHIGVPLTLLSLRAQATAVIEMGANHLGEIATLTHLAQPDVGVITHAGDAHLEGFGSREGVARGKGELFAGLRAQGTAVINADDVYAGLWKTLAGARAQIAFALENSADVRATDVQPLADGSGSTFTLHTPSGRADVRLPLPGRHNVLNALAAAACGVALNLDAATLAEGLARVDAPQGRLTWRQSQQGARVMDDSYNANPSSLRAGMEVLASLPGRRYLALGAMKELGDNAEQLHQQAGQTARALGLDGVFALGDLAAHAARGFGDGGHVFATPQALADALGAKLDARAVVLVKGSRASQMERVVAALVGSTSEGAH
nr:UDP-N-acetylmuramoyl-tripeptide--D-alanyl-D-alanine ligase [Sinimarinibacterium sp. NLF-5-8]